MTRLNPAWGQGPSAVKPGGRNLGAKTQQRRKGAHPGLTWRILVPAKVPIFVPWVGQHGDRAVSHSGSLIMITPCIGCLPILPHFSNPWDELITQKCFPQGLLPGGPSQDSPRGPQTPLSPTARGRESRLLPENHARGSVSAVRS